MDVFEDSISEPGYLALFLELIRVQITALTSLDLDLCVEEIDWEENSALWDALFRFTQLQSLKLTFANGEDPDFYGDSETNLSLSRLRALTSLCNLSSLTVTSEDIIPDQDYTFVSCLTSLTHLELPLILPSDEQPDPNIPNDPPKPRLTAFTTLKNLRSLTLIGRDVDRYGDPPFTAADCSSLAQLTALTKLQLEQLAGLDSQDLLRRLLRPVQQLQVLKLPACKASVALPVLAGLSRLTDLELDQVPESSPCRPGNSSVVCPSVKTLFSLGPVLFEAFPEVEKLSHVEKLDPNRWMNLIHTCKQLKDLRTVQLPEPPLCSLEGRRAVLQGLSELTHLRVLGVAIWDDKELEVVAELLRLRELLLVIPQRCTVAGMLQLEKMKQQGQLQDIIVLAYGSGIDAQGWEQICACLPINKKMSMILPRED